MLLNSIYITSHLNSNPGTGTVPPYGAAGTSYLSSEAMMGREMIRALNKITQLEAKVQLIYLIYTSNKTSNKSYDGPTTLTLKLLEC